MLNLILANYAPLSSGQLVPRSLPPNNLSKSWISFEVHLGNSTALYHLAVQASIVPFVSIPCTVILVNFRSFRAKSNCACAVLEFAWNEQLCKYLFIRHQIRCDSV